MYIANIFKHTRLVSKHKWIVFKLCCRAGEPVRGFIHDLSKFSYTEFWESVKYYQGTRSPISEARKQRGYSKAWLHHRGRNKHHSEYWNDEFSNDSTPVIPYKYAVEMICDKLSAGMIYQGKNWRKEFELEYWNKEKNIIKINKKTEAFITAVLQDVAKNGVNKVVTKKKLKELYKKYCE